MIKVNTLEVYTTRQYTSSFQYNRSEKQLYISKLCIIQEQI